MHEHGPDAPIGPLRGTTVWWQGTGASPEEFDEGTPGTTPRRKAAVRTALVTRIRAEIAAGLYDTPARWEAALDRLLDGVGDG